MDTWKTMGALSIFLAAASVAFGVWGRDGAMIGLSCFAVFFSILSFLRCSGTVHRYSVIMSATVLICTVLSISVASYSSLVDSGTMSMLQWAYISGAVQGAAVIPLIVMFFFTVAALFKASYNWVMMPGLGWLVGMGIQVPKNLSVFVFQLADIQSGIITNNGIVIIMLVGLMMFILFCVILRSVFKKNRYLITASGLAVRP
ncbi:MAG: hypothetical protein LBV13_01110 [Methanomassiliicoccaceae archaeon]|jgi:hypothetical protein|nr:hypothetical protein [Methanomassiliicoccaceae archaeon]